MEQWISLILNVVFGGGFITSMVLLRVQRKQAVASLKSSEIDNVERVATIWRKSLEEREQFFEAEIKDMRKKITGMESTIKSLSATNKQILKILKEINHDNLEQKKEEAQNIASYKA